MIRETRIASAKIKKRANASFGFRQYWWLEIANFLGGFTDFPAMAFPVVELPSVTWPAIPLTYTALFREAGRSKSPLFDGLQNWAFYPTWISNSTFSLFLVVQNQGGKNSNLYNLYVSMLTLAIDIETYDNFFVQQLREWGIEPLIEE